MEISALIIAIASSLLSGLGTAILVTWNERKKELIRIQEKQRDILLLDLKDAEIKFYQIQKDLDDWKLKYYNTIQELIEVKAELERATNKILKLAQE